jgi:tRNA threonylcarbamoyladenosine biosynthesis protein TsaE
MNLEKQVTFTDDETRKLGFEFAKTLKQGDVVALYGGVGAGKTEFIKGVCDYFKVEEIVTSPTFTIMNKYFGDINGEEITIFHIDLYRIKSPKELSEVGFEECVFSENSIKLIEWAEKSGGILPEGRYNVKISQGKDNEDERQFDFSRSNEQ